ncbi:MAG: polyamine aminopropyltransferase [Chloroflexota bacterium]
MSDNVPDKRTWFHDGLTPDLGMVHRVETILYTGRSAYQGIEVMRLRSFGTCLVLDGKIQSSEADEFIYHEALVQPAMMSHPNPRSVLIAGGGEGATLREVLRHKSVERATMVDLDDQVVSVCREYLPSFSAGAFDDSRAERVVGDAREFMQQSPLSFDVIIIDLPDPLESGPAQLLYTREFYSLVRNRLAEGGIMAVQSESSRWYDLQAFVAIVNTLRAVFTYVSPYQVHIPSFSSLWGFTIASDTVQPTQLASEEIDRRIVTRLSFPPRSYDGETHRGLFSLPRHVRSSVDASNLVLTDERPLSVY